MAVCLAHHCGRLEELPVKLSKTLSIDPILNNNPPGLHIDLLCSLCGETDGLMLSLTNPVICRSYGDTTFLFCGLLLFGIKLEHLPADCMVERSR
jgi:hypothetical protein